MCHVLHEAAKGAASLWAPYVAMLPRAYDLLESWSDLEAAQLQARCLPHCPGSQMRCPRCNILWVGGNRLGKTSQLFDAAEAQAFRSRVDTHISSLFNRC